jgi:endonuclease-3
VHRVVNRLGIAEGGVGEVEAVLTEVVPKEYASKVCHWLVWHGRRVCTAKKPRCFECPLNGYCSYYKKSLESRTVEEDAFD